MAQLRKRARPAAQSEQKQQESDASKSEVSIALSEIQAAYGDNALRPASQKSKWKHIPTRIFTLDMALMGGLPESLITLMYGRESSGKTTTCMRLVGQAQRKHPDSMVVWIDVEGTYDATWATRHGVDNERVLLSQPSTGEEALDQANRLIRVQEVCLVIVDSLAALMPYREIDASMEDDLPAIRARLVNKFVMKMGTALLDERKREHMPTLVLLNQWRSKIGVVYGDTRVLPGGMAQNFVASLKIELYNKEHLGKDANDMETVDHNQHSFKIAKNKTGTALRHGEFTMVRNPASPLGQGFIDDGRTVATWARKIGLVTGGGGKFMIDGCDESFRVLEDIVAWFYSDMERYFAFQDKVIGAYRVLNGLSDDAWRT